MSAYWCLTCRTRWEHDSGPVDCKYPREYRCMRKWRERSASETAPLQGNAESPSSSDLNATGAITRPPE